MLRLAYLRALRFLRRNRKTYAATSAGTSSSSQSISGHRNVMAFLPNGDQASAVPDAFAARALPPAAIIIPLGSM
jgi:hypothetical protein